MKTETPLFELCQELNYQDLYDYDKRVELFNKYRISTSQKFIIPIMELSRLIVSGHRNLDGKLPGAGYSHSGNVASSFNRLFDTFKRPENDAVIKQNQYVKVSKGLIAVSLTSGSGFGKDYKLEFKPIVTYYLPDRTVRVWCEGYRVRRTLYAEIDEFLSDFNFKPWEDLQP